MGKRGNALVWLVSRKLEDLRHDLQWLDWPAWRWIEAAMHRDVVCFDDLEPAMGFASRRLCCKTNAGDFAEESSRINGRDAQTCCP